MASNELIEKSATEIWSHLKTRQRVFFASTKDFSPQSLWIVDRFFELCSGDGADKAGSPFDTQDTIPLMFSLGAYIGEVVRRYYGDKCKWGDAVCEEEIELHLPNGKELLHPMLFIGEQITKYQPGSIVKWGRDAGLPVGERPKRTAAQFKPS